MRLEGTFLASRLGRRIFLMFCLAVVIPALSVFWLTYENAAQLASKTDSSSLRAANKHYALSVYGRLEMARLVLARANPVPSEPDSVNLAPIFSEVSVVDETVLAAEASDEDPRLIVRKAGDKTQVSLLLPIIREGKSTLLMGRLNPAFLWGDADAAISNGQVCVSSGAVVLACLGETLPSNSEPVVRDTWDLFLEPGFGAESWRFLATSAPRSHFGQYGNLIAPIGIGMLLLALLLSSVVIRRILIPLEALLGKITAIGGGNASEVVVTDDEFARIDRTFGDMERRIADQIQTLKTLQEVDRLILERVPLLQIVDVVLERIADVVGPRPLALSLSDPGNDQRPRHFLHLPRGDSEVEVQLGADPLDDGGGSLQSPAHGWGSSLAIGPGFAGLDLTGVSFATVGPVEGPTVRLAIGHIQGQTPEDREWHSGGTQSLVDLAERVAVAVASEAHERKLTFQARHDLLTNLPNRLAILEELPKLLREAKRDSVGLAILFIDLDRFKAINDGLGHGLGDSVLVEVSRRIAAAIGPKQLVARLGGDEFLVVIPNVVSTDVVFAIDRAIRRGLQNPIHIAGESLTMDFSAGIAVYPRDGREPETLLHNADLAMYRAKRSGGGAVLAFDSEMNQSAVKRVQMENDLRLALRTEQLFVQYQPRIDSRDGSIVGAEALVRWEHPTLGRVMPDEFISLAEECGLIGDIGVYVINESCRQLSQWKREGLDLPLMAINVSSLQLRSGDLFDKISSALEANDLAWSELEVEITESVLVKDSAYASGQLQRLRDAGATVAIDDFGTGYSSLAYLASLPTDTIKIDRAFSRLLSTQETQSVVRSIIALGIALSKRIVAEGVEKPEDVEMLSSWGCHVIQGYVYFAPLTADAMRMQLRDQAGHANRNGRPSPLLLPLE